MKIEDLKTIDDLKRFRQEVLVPMKPGQEKRKLRQELRAKRRELVAAQQAERKAAKK